MHQIAPYQLWLGNRADLGDLRGIQDEGIRGIIDLAREEPVPRLSRDLLYCRFPLIDGTGNDPWLLVSSIQTAAHLIKLELPTLVVCSTGISRSPAIVAAALSSITLRRPAACLRLVSEHHPHDVSPGLWKEITEVARSLEQAPLATMLPSVVID